uniref:Uncharacterized protein n=1 Tax=Chromera velia CCMP2878 TaxID=1169474 RepID=A0A0G4I552_9ALVE|eukprot:Cvel_11056.t1-p1 / transcript=Cvel_11056.t1 / gene=Cvel_11056 / organism=Chromera_velia_CCMP2878 / gene_product=hypothetical protein / transcript_product=hypothetical protein / location=Cvel_scaffold682:708-2683(+) / protein_length=172 / sequence_SO=supercontig / SO=protein_coding / is_pseudo=false
MQTSPTPQILPEEGKEEGRSIKPETLSPPVSRQERLERCLALKRQIQSNENVIRGLYSEIHTAKCALAKVADVPDERSITNELLVGSLTRSAHSLLQCARASASSGVPMTDATLRLLDGAIHSLEPVRGLDGELDEKLEKLVSVRREKEAANVARKHSRRLSAKNMKGPGGR